jgi:thymidylate synthase (FAD)
MLSKVEPKVRLVSKTVGVGGETPEQLIAYTARVSNPSNQNNHQTAPKLIKYLVKHKHWSPLEMADMTFEITTSTPIAAQILRHKSLVFQQFSARYSEVNNYIEYGARRQDAKNKQNSIDDMEELDREWFKQAQLNINRSAYALYKEALDRGIAKECARTLLTNGTSTTMYAKGSVRSWVHYCEVRCDPSTQLEHRVVAEAIKAIICEELPSVAEAVGWINKEES